MTALNYRKVEPIGERMEFAHQNMGDQPHVWGSMKFYDYPPSPHGKQLSKLRRELGLYLGAAAKALGLGLAEFSALERGAATCNWEEAERLLRAAKETRP